MIYSCRTHKSSMYSVFIAVSVLLSATCLNMQNA